MPNASNCARESREMAKTTGGWPPLGRRQTPIHSTEKVRFVSPIETWDGRSPFGIHLGWSEPEVPKASPERYLSKNGQEIRFLLFPTRSIRKVHWRPAMALLEDENPPKQFPYRLGVRMETTVIKSRAFFVAAIFVSVLLAMAIIYIYRGH